jgi:hypothetical protein
MMEQKKKPYHSPKLKACGDVKEQTKTGWGPLPSDAAWSWSVSQP